MTMQRSLHDSAIPASAAGFLAICALLVLACGAPAASADPPGKGGTNRPKSEGVGEPGEDAFGLKLPALAEPAPRPWSNKPVLNDPLSFQFAVVTDRTGGHRPGVWMHGVRNLNLLRPEFVVSVGDLIEGYTTDLKVIDSQWSEFLGFIDRLDMRFFFVAGNHDVTNPLLHRVWKKRFGLEWYSFDYKGVHFICLSSEDPQARVGEEQLAWLENDLQQHTDARWTFFFLHKPLWAYTDRDLAAGNTDSSNWSKVNEMLGERPYTAFAGHHHRYVQFDRRGRKYYQLGTTGGGSQLRGEAYGEFDHITWVTMEEQGPRVANIKLDGVLPADVVTEQKAQHFRDFLTQARLDVEPVFVAGSDSIQEGEIRLTLTNEFTDVVNVETTIAGLPLQGLSVDPVSQRLRATPHGKAQSVSRFRLADPLPLSSFQQVSLTARIRSEGSGDLQAEISLPVMVDRRYVVELKDIQVDGELADWANVTTMEFPRVNPPLLGAAQRWQGAEDATMEFSRRPRRQDVVLRRRSTR